MYNQYIPYIIAVLMHEASRNSMFPTASTSDPCEISTAICNNGAIKCRLEKNVNNGERNSGERKTFHKRLNRWICTKLSNDGVFGVNPRCGFIGDYPVLFAAKLLDCIDYWEVYIIVATPANANQYVRYVHQLSHLI